MATFSEQELLSRLYNALTYDSQGRAAFRTLAAGLAADEVKDYNIDFGIGDNQVSAVDIPLADVGENFTTDNVEAALTQLAAAVAAAGAPKDATYWTSAANGTLTNEVNLGALTTGLLKHTVTGGVSTPARALPGTDYYAPGMAVDLPVAEGGTGASTAAGARTALGLVIGTDVQAQSALLSAIAGLTPTDSNFIVGNGATWVVESGATVRTSLGLGTLATQNADNVSISGGVIGGITDLAIADGGTGASTASGARTNLGLGTIATQNASNVSISGGAISGITDLAVADGGTGASDASGARSNLGAAALGSNSDITALTGIAAQGGVILNPFGASAGNTSELRFKELAANGTDYVGFKAPDTITASLVWTLPATDGEDGASLQTNGSGTLSWGRTSNIEFGTGADGAVSWATSTNLDPSTPKHYTSATLAAGQTLSVSTVNVPLIIHTTGNVTINGVVDLNGKGGAGGAGGVYKGQGGDGTDGASIASGMANGKGVKGPTYSGAGGGGASSFASASGGSSVGGAGVGTNGSSLSATLLALLANTRRGAVCGAGGGGGCSNNSYQDRVPAAGGAGGAGGGCLVWMIGGNLTIGANGVLRCAGIDGSSGAGGGYNSVSSSYEVGGGGGGGGGGGTIIIIVAGTITNSNAAKTGWSVAAGGGGGGGGNGIGGAASTGGSGGAGKIIIYSLSTGTSIIL